MKYHQKREVRPGFDFLCICKEKQDKIIIFVGACPCPPPSTSKFLDSCTFMHVFSSIAHMPVNGDENIYLGKSGAGTCSLLPSTLNERRLFIADN